MTIKILGLGCSKCKMLEKLTLKAVSDLGVTADVSKVDDMMKIIEYGVMQTPALVINEKVVVSGRLPSMVEIKELIKELA